MEARPEEPIVWCKLLVQGFLLHVNDAMLIPWSCSSTLDEPLEAQSHVPVHAACHKQTLLSGIVK